MRKDHAHFNKKPRLRIPRLLVRIECTKEHPPTCECGDCGYIFEEYEEA